MICDIIPIFLAARSGIKLCCTAVNRPWNNHNLFHRRGLETCQPEQEDEAEPSLSCKFQSIVSPLEYQTFAEISSYALRW